MKNKQAQVQAATTAAMAVVGDARRDQLISGAGGLVGARIYGEITVTGTSTHIRAIADKVHLRGHGQLPARVFSGATYGEANSQAAASQKMATEKGSAMANEQG